MATSKKTSNASAVEFQTRAALVLSGVADQINGFASEKELEEFLLKEAAKTDEELRSEMAARLAAVRKMQKTPV